MNINDIYVSACRGAFDRNTYDVRLVDWLENVRPQIPLNDYAKKQLPAIMPHGVFATRRQDSIRVHSGLVQIDIDAKHQKKGFNVDTVLQQMQDHKNILSCGRSCGGEGVFALYLVEGIDDNMHVQAAMAVMDDVRFWFKVEPDAPVSNNLSSLRFASPYAPYINLDVTPFNLDK
jgi:hypothetical protein